MASLILNGYTISIDGTPIVVPSSFDTQSFQDQINTAADIARNPGAQGINTFLAMNFVWGGSGDLQRPNGANGGFVSAYTPAAAYLYGASAAVSGLTLSDALSAAGKLNLASTSGDTNVAYGLSQDRIDQITQAYTDYSKGLFAPDSSTSSTAMNNIIAYDESNIPSLLPAFASTIGTLASNYVGKEISQFSALASEFGNNLFGNVFSSSAAPQTITNTDGSSYVVQSNANGGSIAFYDPANTAVANLNYFLNSNGSYCTITDPTGAGSVAANGQLLSFASGFTPNFAADSLGNVDVTLTPTSGSGAAVTYGLTNGGFTTHVGGQQVVFGLTGQAASIDANGTLTIGSALGDITISKDVIPANDNILRAALVRMVGQ